MLIETVPLVRGLLGLRLLVSGFGVYGYSGVFANSTVRRLELRYVCFYCFIFA